MSPEPQAPSRRVRVGGLPIDRLTLDGAIDAIEGLVSSGRGGAVFTPNVDHVVEYQDNARLREAYEAASLSLVDGVPVLWASHLLGEPLPEKVSGSDLVVPLLRQAAKLGWRVFLLGGGDGVAEMAKRSLEDSVPGIAVVGALSPRIDMRQESAVRAPIVEAIGRAAPHLVIVALGAPKQELFIHEARAALRPAVLLGLGASLDFIAGTVPRAPAWMSRSGLEWLFRLSREPRRLWRRYLVRDPRFLLILARSVRDARVRREMPE
jgi:N-acetylglucosaminyldiphosphoundecaprenol N-acetyl-beta-D-mannosaminyltransferase